MYAPLGHTLGHDALIHCTELHQSDTFLNQLRLGQWIHLGSLRLPKRESGSSSTTSTIRLL